MTAEPQVILETSSYQAAKERCVPVDWVFPRGDAKGGVVFQHEASGNKTRFADEAHRWAEAGWACCLPDAPWARLGEDHAPLDTSSPKALRAYLEDLCEDLACGVDALDKQLGDTLPIVYVGLNIGGAVAGAVALKTPRLYGIIGLACLPRMSRFWQTSDHPAAVRNRGTDPAAFSVSWAAGEPFDLWTTVPALECPALFQFGSADTWVTAPDRAAFMEHIGDKAMIEVFDDNHAFQGQDAENARRAWSNKTFVERSATAHS